MLKRILSVVLLLFLGIGIFGTNQEVNAAGTGFNQNIKGKWVLKFQTDTKVEKNYALTKTENDYCRKKMLQLTEIFKNNPTIKPLKGFNFKSYTCYTPPDDWYGQHKPPYKNLRVRMEFRASLPELYYSKGKVAESMEPPYLDVTFNDPFTFINNWQLQYQGLFDQQGRIIFLQPYSERKVGGVTVYERGHTVIIAKKNRPLWIPATREQYLKAILWHYQQMKKKGDGDPSILLNYIQTELNALSPEERRQPARYSSGAEDPTGLCSQDEEGAFNLVTVNPNYYDRSLSRTAIQLIVIKYGYGGGFTSYEQGDKMVFEKAGTNKTLYDLEKSLNYKAIEKLLD